MSRLNSPNGSTSDHVSAWLATFNLEPILHGHVAAVVTALPQSVRDDLLCDPAFLLCDYEPAAGTMVCVPLRLAMPRRPARSVVFKRTLRRRPEKFIRWVIAHELAHAHLRNRGRIDGEDPEHAADSLAADWGFPRP